MQRNFTLHGSIVSLCSILILSSLKLSAQIVTVSPRNVIRSTGQDDIDVFPGTLSGAWANNGPCVWSVSPSIVVVGKEKIQMKNGSRFQSAKIIISQ
ncbi:MAG TPA: hypothetical protein VI461_16140 [Chitinophagaceae bacterium]|nr:hypothetical protein [Chitinophagaceae bacterium]